MGENALNQSIAVLFDHQYLCKESGDIFMFKSFFKPNMWKNNKFLTNPSFLLKFFDDVFQACLCLLSSYV